MNVSLASGRLSYFADVPGTGPSASYNGILGVAFDKSEKYAFLTSADGKQVRLLTVATNYVGYSITRESYFLNFQNLLLLFQRHFLGVTQWEW
jgi:hypothetical protein